MSERLEFVHTKLVKDSWLFPPVYINSPSDAVLAIRDMIGELDKEVCAVVNLSTRGQVINASNKRNGICIKGMNYRTPLKYVRILNN